MLNIVSQCWASEGFREAITMALKENFWPENWHTQLVCISFHQKIEAIKMQEKLIKSTKKT